MKVAVVGTGYVGLTVGACFAETGHEVICVDVDAQKIDRLQQGTVPIYEPGLPDIVIRNISAGRLNFTTDVKGAIEFAEIVVSAVGTPPDADHRADLTAVRQVASDFGSFANGYKLFVNKSTVPVGTGALSEEIIRHALIARGASYEFDVVSNPEFLREGVAVTDCLKPDRIIVGTKSERAREIMHKLYVPIIEKGATFFCTDIKSAELIKYASNAFLATKISFMNEISALCESVGADVTAVERGVGLDSRIGRRFLHAGIGYGGSCFPKDVDALLLTAHDAACEFRILRAARDVNHDQKHVLIGKLRKFIDLRDKRIALWGLAFKPKTDDMREAPSLVIIKELLEAKAHIAAFDPAAVKNARQHFPDISYASSALDAVKDADALLLLTEWDEFRSVDFRKIRELMRGSVIGDGRNIWQPEELRALGFTYFSIGRA